MDQSTHNVRYANWMDIIRQCQDRPVNMTVKQWLSDNEISSKAYYYWLRKLRNEAYNQIQTKVTAPATDVDFAEITVPLDDRSESLHSIPDKTPVAVIRCNRFSVEITNDISKALLNRILQEVSHA